MKTKKLTRIMISEIQIINNNTKPFKGSYKRFK